MDLLKAFKRSMSLSIWLLVASPAAQALICNGAGCQCSSTFGIGFVQGTDGIGNIPNFELAVPHAGGGFSAYYRNNHIQNPTKVGAETWFGPQTVATGDINGIAMLENAVTNPSGPIPPVPGRGNLEVILVRDSNLYHYWRDRATKQWSSGTWIAGGFTGQPGFTQSKDWHENFEVVVPRLGGGLAHYWRDNSIPSMPWHGPNVFAQGINFEAVSLVESNFDNGNLEVVARAGQTLYHIWRGDNLVWSSPREIRVDGNNPIQATGVHSFVQGKSGNKGDFELVVPLANGGLMHYSRNNDITVGGFYPWSTVGWVDPVNRYSAAGVIVSGNNRLEVVGRRSSDGSLAAFNSNSSYDAWDKKGIDASGNTVWAGAVFGGEPCCDPVTRGRWQNPYNTGAIGIHAALLPNSKVLLFGFGDDNDMGYSEIFDPANGLSTQPILDPTAPMVPHAFCSGHTLMSDGKLWVAGGHDHPDPAHERHVDDSHLFDFKYSMWTKPTAIQLTTGRWYPTLTRLENGDVLILSGAKEVGRTPVADEVNLYWQTLNSSGTTLSPEDSARMVPTPFDPDETGKNFLQLYPFAFQLPDGQVFVHSYRTSRFFSPLTSNTWSATKYVTQYAYSRTYPGYGSAVLMPLSPDDGYAARIMLFGGGGNVSNEAQSQASDTTIPATNTVEQLDLGDSSPQWAFKAPMKHPRVLNNAVLLPDGTVFVVGGSTHGSSDHAAYPVMTPEIYDPNNDSWTEMCPMRVARLYHSTALLLPDARIMTAGRDHAWNEAPYKWPERRVEIFSPPYLESGNPRPVITALSNDKPAYSQSFTVTLNSAVSASNISSAVLMSPGATTHGFDQSQRAVKLSISGRSGNTLTLTAPPNGKVAPPGYYMLFVLSSQGVPSVSKFIQLQ